MQPPAITSYGHHVPVNRLARELVAAAWGTPSVGGCRAIAGFDEDSLTMAFQAASKTLARVRVGKLDGLFFCSTTAPFAERSNAALIAAALDLPESCLTVDIGSSLRAGTSGINVSLDMVSAGQERILVTAADKRDLEPGSPEEQFIGDAAAAVMIGSENPLAILEAKVSRYDDFWDALRRGHDDYLTTFSSRFTQSRGYRENVSWVVERLLTSVGISKSGITKLVLPSPDGAVHSRAAKALGFSVEQVQEPLFQEYGFVGTAAPLLSLCLVLDAAKPGDRLLVIGYGEGTDGFIFKVTDRIRSMDRVSPVAGRTVPFSSYQLCIAARRSLSNQAARLEMSNVFYAREEEQNIRLHGSKCRKCGLVQFPITEVCIGCRTVQQMETIALSRCGHVFTYTVDYLYPSPNKATIMTVVDLENGGRLYLQMTDAEPEEIAIGMPVELTFRRLRDIHYYWKCRPRKH